MLDKRDVLDLLHGRSRITIDPRIPTMSAHGACRVLTDQADIALLAPSAKRREVSGESHEG